MELLYDWVVLGYKRDRTANVCLLEQLCVSNNSLITLTLIKNGRLLWPWCWLWFLFLLSLSFQVRPRISWKGTSLAIAKSVIVEFFSNVRNLCLKQKKLWLGISCFRHSKVLCTNQTQGSLPYYCLLRSKFCINLSWRFRNLSSHFLNNTVYTRLKLIQFQFCVYAIKIGNCKIWRFVRCCLLRKKRIH